MGAPPFSPPASFARSDCRASGRTRPDSQVRRTRAFRTQRDMPLSADQEGKRVKSPGSSLHPRWAVVYAKSLRLPRRWHAGRRQVALQPLPLAGPHVEPSQPTQKSATRPAASSGAEPAVIRCARDKRELSGVAFSLGLQEVLDRGESALHLPLERVHHEPAGARTTPDCRAARNCPTLSQ